MHFFAARVTTLVFVCLSIACDQGQHPSKQSTEDRSAIDFSDAYVLRDSTVFEETDSIIVARPSRVIWTDSTILVADGSEGNVKIYTKQGRLVRTLGRKGRGPGEFVLPAAMAVSGDTIFVLDGGAGVVTAFERSGEFLQTTRLEVTIASDLELLADGNFLVTGTVSKADSAVAHVVDRRGKVVRSLLPIRKRDAYMARGKNPMWRVVLDFKTAVHRDTLYATSSLPDSLWKVDIGTGNTTSALLTFPNYVPPTEPPAAGLPQDIIKWMESYYSARRIIVNDSMAVVAYVKGNGSEAEATLLIGKNNFWRALTRAPAIIAVHDDGFAGAITIDADRVVSRTYKSH